MGSLRTLSWVTAISVILSWCGAIGTPLARAQTSAKTPTVKLYISEQEGFTDIDTDSFVREVGKNTVYNAAQAIIQTKADSKTSLVFSNGVGVFLSPETTLRVEHFTQEPFLPNRADLELEPSISRMTLSIRSGSVGICTSRLMPGSTLELRTPHGVVTLRGKQLVVETNEQGTVFSLLEGDLTARTLALENAGQRFTGGNRAVLRQQRLGDPLVVEVEPIPDSAKRGLEDKAAYACMARQTVYFDVGEDDPEGNLRGRSGISVFDSPDEEPTADVLRPLPVVPTIPENPTFVSPAEIPNPNASGNPT
ncbi:MAG TPA: FecR domain-containing protein [Opitutaceae bacterium]|nr:FecR domain-containing protein [Opitutaceae bacterium]